MDKDKLLKQIASVVMEYESESGNNSIVGCYVQFMDDESTYEFNGESFDREDISFEKH